MVEIEINIKMKNLFGKTIAFLVLLSVFGISAFSQEISWSRAKIDASRTGVVASDADNTEETMGKIIGKKYIAPNGRIFRKRNGVTYNVAGQDERCQKGDRSVCIIDAKEISGE